MNDTTTPVLYDVESRSRADLKKCGGRRYWQHPSTVVLCICWHDVATGEAGTWFPGDSWAHHGRTMAAHNAGGFDRFALDRVGLAGLADPWIDTADLARRAGLPGALDELGQRVLGAPKDAEGSKITRAMSSVRRPTKGPDAIPAKLWARMAPEAKREEGVLPEVTPATLARVVEYCRADVAILRDAWPMLVDWLDVSSTEARALDAHREINDRGVRFDVDLAQALIYYDARNTDAVIDEVAAELDATPEEVRAAASSPAQFCALTGAANARKQTVVALGDDHPLGRARRALASIVRGKLEAGLARVCPDGRMRDAHQYCGAHTWRWSGRGMQLHNLPRPAGMFEEWTDQQIAELAGEVKRYRHQPTPEEVVLLLRATICAAPGHTLAVCDYAGVEARALAWVAGDVDALEVFRSGKDPYKVMASVIFGVSYDAVTKPQRTVGKIAELAAGYGMGADKFDATAKNFGVSLGAIGVNPALVIAAWRKLHAPIVALWRACEVAIAQAVDGAGSTVACFDFVPGPAGVAVILPSGRPLAYPGAHRGGRGVEYDGHRGPANLYGGLIVENLIQALCRDMLADALVSSEAAGLRPVLHVHDEIVGEVPADAGPEALELLHATMIDLPPWAYGFPVGAAGFVGTKYRK